MTEYSFTSEKIEHGNGYWGGLLYTIYADGVECGTLYRNYPGNAFPLFFQQDGVDYMLCSPHYTATSVYRLPEFVLQASEDPSTFGFCPVEFYIPPDNENENYHPNEDGSITHTPLNGQYALVSGCVWGDDTSWKLEILDLTKLSEGKIRRCIPGYHELPDIPLRDSILWFDFDGTDFEAMVAVGGYSLVKPQ